MVKIKQASILHHLNGLPAFFHCIHAKKSITIVASENSGNIYIPNNNGQLLTARYDKQLLENQKHEDVATHVTHVTVLSHRDYTVRQSMQKKVGYTSLCIEHFQLVYDENTLPLYCIYNSIYLHHRHATRSLTLIPNQCCPRHKSDIIDVYAHCYYMYVHIVIIIHNNKNDNNSQKYITH